MPKPNKQALIDILIKCIENGKERAESMSIFGEKCQTSSRTFDRYWKIAQEQHLERQQAIKSKLLEIDTEKAIEARKRDIMSKEDKLEFLTKVVKGEIDSPTITEKIKAISELNKMEGDYAPSKVEHSGTIDSTKNINYNNFTDEELRLIAELQSKSGIGTSKSA